MKTIIGIIVALLTGVQSHALALWPTYGDKSMAIVQKEVPDFESLVVDGPFQVKIDSGDLSKVVIEGEQNMIDATEVKVVGHELMIRELKWLKPQKPLKVRITKSRLNRLTAKGHGNIEWSRLDGPHLHLKLMGSGHLRGSVLTTEKLSIEAFGSGSIMLSGEVRVVIAQSSGSTNTFLNLAKLTRADLEGSGSVTFFLKSAEKVNLKLDGTSHLTFAGDPSVIDSQMRGSSQVTFEKP